MGKAAGVSRSTVISASAGRSLRSSATAFCTCCRATTMSVLVSNCAEISVAPRKVLDRTRRMPGTSMMACSMGRVTVSIIERPGMVPTWAMTTTRGNFSGG
jgi:hypothetical protein